MDVLIPIGAIFIFLGITIRLLPRWGHFQWSAEIRQALIEEAEAKGDVQKAEKLRHEIFVFEKRLPVYGASVAVVGAIILVAAFFLH